MRLGPREAAGGSGGFNPGRWGMPLGVGPRAAVRSPQRRWGAAVPAPGPRPPPWHRDWKRSRAGTRRSGEMVSSSMVGMLGGPLPPTTESGHVPRMTRSNRGQGPRTEGTRAAFLPTGRGESPGPRAALPKTLGCFS